MRACLFREQAMRATEVAWPPHGIAAPRPHRETATLVLSEPPSCCRLAGALCGRSREVTPPRTALQLAAVPAGAYAHSGRGMEAARRRHRRSRGPRGGAEHGKEPQRRSPQPAAAGDDGIGRESNPAAASTQQPRASRSSCPRPRARCAVLLLGCSTCGGRGRGGVFTYGALMGGLVARGRTGRRGRRAGEAGPAAHAVAHVDTYSYVLRCMVTGAVYS